MRAELTDTQIKVNTAGITDNAITAITTAIRTRIQKD